MATAVPLNTVTDVTLGAAEAVEQLTLGVGARWLILWESDVDVSIVTVSDGTAADDGRLVPAAAMDGGWQLDIAGYGFIGLAGSGAGTCRVEIR